MVGMPEQEDEERRQAESEFERRNRNFNELLQELRVAQTGVQILFAFLLTLPFSSRFGQLGEFSRDLYVVTIVAAATATALLIAPVAYHRQVFREGRKAEVIAVASRLAEFGLAAMVVAVVGALYIAVGVVVGRPAAIIVACVAALYAVLWYLLPAINRRRMVIGPSSGPEGRLARQRHRDQDRSSEDSADRRDDQA
jgi:O-antigen/teichoic acid export membrane protein